MFLPGLNAKKSIAVTFHCILPKLLWEWNEMSCMHMRFEGHNLGNWEDNVGDFIPKRFVTLDLVARVCACVYAGIEYLIRQPFLQCTSTIQD